MFLDIAKNIILLRSVHLAELIHDRSLESEEKNSKIPGFMTVCRGDRDLGNNIIVSVLGIISAWPLGHCMLSFAVPVSFEDVLLHDIMISKVLLFR